MMDQPLFEARNLTVNFGGILALNQLHLKISDLGSHGLIGPNGAGKTTFFNCLTGFCLWSSGQIFFRGKELKNITPESAASHGIFRSFQNVALMPGLSVIDNVSLGGFSQSHCTWPQIFFSPSKIKALEKKEFSEILELFEEFRLQEYLPKKVQELPLGVLKRIELIRTLRAKPKVLLLDEPASGLSAEERETLSQQIVSIKEKFNLRLVVIEHNISFLQKICDSLHAFDSGQLLASGPMAEVLNLHEVQSSYLGVRP